MNKDSAQAGGAHHCVEANCALWDSRYEQCSVKTACENTGSATPQAKKPRGVSDILAKIRSKKKPVEANTTPPTTPAPVDISASATTPTPVLPPAINIDVRANIETSDTETPATEPKPDLKELLVAPSIDVAELPIVTSSQETDNGPTRSQ